MVALRGKEIDAFLARPDAGRPIILLYGPDAGLVRERADALMASAVDDPYDPFSLVRLDGDELATEPSRLVEEAMTIPMFGGRRAIRVRAGSRNFASGVDTLSEMPIKDCLIAIAAVEMCSESPLPKGCERATSAVVESGFPRLHFSRKSNVETALRNFTTARLLAIIEQLAVAALEMRKQSALAAVIAQRTLLSIAVNARRRG